MKEMAHKYNIKLNLTAANSPWSNCTNERNHYTCDRTVDKLLEDDPNLKLEEAVSHAVHAHNVQINRSGFSPNQLMFGKQTVIPGIFEGNPASMEPIVESEIFRKEFINRKKSEDLYRNFEAKDRIQKTFAQQTYGYKDFHYNVGNSVLFKEDGKNGWDQLKLQDLMETK